MHDIIIIGAGLAGSMAAACLGRAGYDVVLIERNTEHPAEFAAEQIVGGQVNMFRRLGVLDSIVGNVQEIRHVEIARRGRIIGTIDEAHYGLSYRSMVQGARHAIPRSVNKRLACVTEIRETADAARVIRLATGEAISARLIVLATGLKSWHALGFDRQMIARNHSLSLGFDIEGPSYRNVLTYFPENLLDRIDYLTLFPMEGKLRANLFTYREPNDEWVRLFKLSPGFYLDHRLPGLKSVIGDYLVSPKVEARAVSLYVTTGVNKNGLVVIGNAFQTSCPAVGSGIGRIATDVDLLCNAYIPGWLKTPGMGWDKIEGFYRDPIKMAVDAEALRAAAYRRAAATETGLGWRLHRGRVRLHRMLQKWAGVALPASTPAPMAGGRSRGIGETS